MDKIFAEGLIWKDPHEKAPDFIKGSIVIQAEKFTEFMKNNMQHASAKGWLSILMKESKSGSIYFELDTWKPTPKEEVKKEDTGTTKYIDENGVEQEIPF